MFKTRLAMLILFLSVVSYSGVVSAGAQPKKIQWLLNDAPPFFILSGEHQYQGICDVTLAYLKKALPDIEHEELVMPHTRLGKYMDEGAKACFPCMIKRAQPTARATYSKPTVVYPPHIVVATQSFVTQQKFSKQTPVSLKVLLTTDSVVFAKHGGRKFGAVLDAILSRYSEDVDTVILRNEGRSTTSVLEMLRLGRADFSIEYPAIVNYYNTSQQHQLQSIDIVENRHTPVAGAIGCATTAPDDFAKNALLEINNALTTITEDKTYQEQVTQWFSRDDTYRNWYQTLVLSPLRLRPSD